MGQYHIPVNLSKREFIYPHSFGDGSKLMEQGMSGFSTMFALGYLLENDWKGDIITMAGDYEQEGDYDPKVLTDLGIDAGTQSIYGLCGAKYGMDVFEIYDGAKGTGTYDEIGFKTAQTFKDVTSRTIASIEKDDLAIFGPTKWGFDGFDKLNYGASQEMTVLYNADRNEVIDPRVFGDASKLMRYASGHSGGTMTAIAILLALTCNGGARGGGDIYSESPLVGSWALNRISVEPRAILKTATDISLDVRNIIAECERVVYSKSASGKVTRKYSWDN